MERSKVAIFQICRQLHTLTRNGPSDTFKRRISELEKERRRRNPKRNQLFVETPEGTSWLDTASVPMFATVAGIALFAKLLMMYDESTEQERIEKKIKKLPPGTGTIRQVTREEWEERKHMWPQTPYQSKFSRPNSRIRRHGDPLHMEDVKNWSIDMLMDGLTRAEEIAKDGGSM